MRSAMLHSNERQRPHWACLQYGHTGETRRWLGVERYIPKRKVPICEQHQWVTEFHCVWSVVGWLIVNQLSILLVVPNVIERKTKREKVQMKPPHENLFSAGSSHLEPMCARRWAVAQFLALLVVPWYVKSCYLGQETCIISKHQATTMTIAIILYQMQMPSYSKRYNVHIPSNEREMERNNQK